ncbi:MAG: M28 family peptidase, partial [Lachnospiraceae bacterium]|nr:M28 family peptidase [Lachnospiraceae bacterium]
MRKNALTRFFLAAAAVLLALSLTGMPGTRDALADNHDYAVAAFDYLKYIDRNLGYRVSNVEFSADTSGRDRMGAWLRQEMQNLGYTVQEYPFDTVNGSHIVSYTARKPGRSAKRIVIGAHYDCVETKGIEDNGTGVSVVLELMKRFRDTETPLTLEFCFWDGEETLGYAGSFAYVGMCPDLSDVLCYINLDSVGAGDRLYAYGGVYNDDGVLEQDWVLNMALTMASYNAVDLYLMPEGVTKYKSPTRDTNSDQHYFLRKGIPYVYFEANGWINEDGTLHGDRPQDYNSFLPAFAETDGHIIHEPAFEDLAVLEDLLPGRIYSHMYQVSVVVSEMIRYMEVESREYYARRIAEPAVYVPPATEPPETEPPVTEPPETEPPVTEPPVTVPPVTEPPATEPPVTEPPVTEPPVTEPPAT